MRLFEEGIGTAAAARVHNAIALLRPMIDTDGMQARQHKTALYNSIFRADDEMLINPQVHGVAAAYAPVLHLARSKLAGCSPRTSTVSSASGLTPPPWMPRYPCSYRDHPNWLLADTPDEDVRSFITCRTISRVHNVNSNDICRGSASTLNACGRAICCPTASAAGPGTWASRRPCYPHETWPASWGLPPWENLWNPGLSLFAGRERSMMITLSQSRRSADVEEREVSNRLADIASHNTVSTA